MHRHLASLSCLAVLAVPATGPAKAETISGPVPAIVERVVDGDTLAVRARVWLGQDVHVLVRVRGIDAPELRGRCATEKRDAVRASRQAADVLADGAVTLFRVEGGKYHGRVVADVQLTDGRDLGTVMIETGAARRYDGNARAGWCAG